LSIFINTACAALVYLFILGMSPSKVVNVVASLQLSCPLDLQHIQAAQKVCCRLRSNALTIKLERSPITTRIFKSGNVILLGGKSEKQVFLFARRLVRLLRKLGVKDCSIKRFSITNVVASCKLCCKLDLVRFAEDNAVNSSYEVDLFPGLQYTFGDVKTSKQKATIFVHGKLYVTGFKSEDEALQALVQLEDMLIEYEVCV